MTRIRLGPEIRLIVIASVGGVAGLVLGWLATLVGARQADEYEFVMTDVSGLGFVFWLGILGLFFLEGARFLRAHAFETGIIVFYLATYWVIEVTARVFESGLLLVLIAGLALSGWRRLAYCSAIVLVQFALMWVTQIGQPAWGFGIG